MSTRPISLVGLSPSDRNIPTEDDDNTSVSSLGEEVYHDTTDDAREEMARKLKEREAEELALRLRVALQVPYNGLRSDSNTSNTKNTAADDYKEVKLLINRINDLSSRMSVRMHEILQAQNMLGRDTDTICDKLESTLKQGLKNAEEYRIRIDRLYILREENRQEHLSKMEKLRYDFVAKLREEKSRSDKEWKVMKKQLESVQDDKKGIGSLESTIRAMMWNLTTRMHFRKAER